MKRNSRRRDKTSGCSSPFSPNIMEIFEQNRKQVNIARSLKEVKACMKSLSLTVATWYVFHNSIVLVIDGTSWEYLASMLFMSSMSITRNLQSEYLNFSIICIMGFVCFIYVLTLSHSLSLSLCSYVDSYYLTSRWQDTYENNIKHVNGQRLWEKTGKETVQIPEKIRMPGRPKNYDRIKEAHESKTNPTKVTREGRRMTCSNCKKTGHNCGTCTLQAAPELPKRKRGRPKKTPVSYKLICICEACLLMCMLIHICFSLWSIQNAPKRRRNAKSQSTPNPVST